jgi:hypothetical protein
MTRSAMQELAARIVAENPGITTIRALRLLRKETNIAIPREDNGAIVIGEGGYPLLHWPLKTLNEAVRAAMQKEESGTLSKEILENNGWVFDQQTLRRSDLTILAKAFMQIHGKTASMVKLITALRTATKEFIPCENDGKQLTDDYDMLYNRWPLADLIRAYREASES